VGLNGDGAPFDRTHHIDGCGPNEASTLETREGSTRKARDPGPHPATTTTRLASGTRVRAFDKTLPFIRAHYFWEHTRRAYIASCLTCQARTTPCHPSHGHLYPIEVHAPWEILAMDVLGPLPTSQAGSKYILVCMDPFTTWVEAFPLPTRDAPTLARPLVDLFCRFGCPQRLLSDNGPTLASGLLKEVTDIFLVKRVFTAPNHHPQTDGLCERCMATIASMLCKFFNTWQSDWDTYLPQLLFAYRSCHEATIGIPPCSAALPITRPTHRPSWTTALGRAITLANSATPWHKPTQRCSHTATPCTSAARTPTTTIIPPSPLAVGNQVMLHNAAARRGTTTKLSHPWQGHYTFANLPPDGAVATLCSAHGHLLRYKASVVRLRPHVPRSPKWTQAPPDNRNKDMVSMAPTAKASDQVPRDARIEKEVDAIGKWNVQLHSSMCTDRSGSHAGTHAHPHPRLHTERTHARPMCVLSHGHAPTLFPCRRATVGRTLFLAHAGPLQEQLATA
jgi:hypothetical protein